MEEMEREMNRLEPTWLVLLSILAACGVVDAESVDASNNIDARTSDANEGIDARTSDANEGTDAAVAVDADVEPEPDADVPPPPLTAWGTPQLVPELNSATLSDFKPTLRGDLLELFFYRPGLEPGGRMTYRSIREGVGDAWSTPTSDLGIANRGTPELSADGTEVYVVLSLNEIHRAFRPSPQYSWSAFSSMFQGQSPSISGDGLTIYYVNDATKEIEKRQRATLAANWGGALPAGLPGNPLYLAVAVSRDERVVVLSGPVNEEPFNVEFTRETTTTAWTGPSEIASLISAGNCNLATAYIMYCGIVNTANGTADIYRLER